MHPTLESIRQGSRASIARLRGRLGRHVSFGRALLLGLLAVVLAVIIADISSVVRLPFYPFATKGAIYVDSPEVYTRERLVNDRYDQDHWLRRQLEELDAANNLLTGRMTIRRAVGFGAGDAGSAASADRDGPDVPLGGEVELPFDQEFRIRAATRDMIRQTILENMLDDRHDLTGNSVYGLKFDTTVIPGTNTHQRAFVRIALDVEPLFVGQGSSVDGLPTHVRQFFDLGFAGIEHRHDNKLFKPYVLYKRWLESIEFRLNNYLSVFYDSPQFDSACPGAGRKELRETTWKMFEAVLGMDQRPALPNFISVPEVGESAAAEADKATSPGVDQSTPAETDEATAAEADKATSPEVDKATSPEVDKATSPEVDKATSPEVDESTTAKAYDAAAARSAITLPQPWADFLVLRQVGNDLCKKSVRFEVVPLDETVYIFPAPDDTLWAKLWGKDADPVSPVAFGYFPISRTASGEQVAVHNLYERSPNTQDEFESIKPKYVITESLIAYARGRDRVFPTCAKPPPETAAPKPNETATPESDESAAPESDGPAVPESGESAASEPEGPDVCEAPIQMTMVPSGFFNFIEQIIRTDAYSYAIFPKNDLIGLIADTSRSASLQERLGGDAGVGAWLELVQAMREASTRSVAIGFGDQTSARDRRVEFGWVLSNGGDMQPVQKAQLALVSVPAWTSELRVHVTTGWLDRNASEHAARTVEMVVPLPPEYEAFDSYVGRSQLRRQPKILNDFLEDNIIVTACRDAEILIPGFRLWRSTSVTLGAQQADRIRVLPNMQGIVAHFAPVHPPYAKDITEPAKVRLRVWTSEGMDIAEDPVSIKWPTDFADERCPEPRAARRSVSAPVMRR